MSRHQKPKSSPEKKTANKRQDIAKDFQKSKSRKPTKRPQSKTPTQRPQPQSRVQNPKTPRPKSHQLLKTCLKTLTLSLWLLLAVIGSEYLLAGIFRIILPPESLGSPLVVALYSCLSYLLALVLILWVGPSFSFELKTDTRHLKTPVFQKPSRESLGLDNFPTWTDIGLAPIGYIISLLLAAGLVAFFSLFPWFNASEPQATIFSPFLNPYERSLAFLILVVVAPIAEEILFRGWLYDKLRHLIPLPLAILLTSLLFAVVHGQWNVGVTVFALSVVMCLQREITGTIYSGILLHILKNAIAFYLIYVVGFI